MTPTDDAPTHQEVFLSSLSTRYEQGLNTQRSIVFELMESINSSAARILRDELATEVKQKFDNQMAYLNIRLDQFDFLEICVPDK